MTDDPLAEEFATAVVVLVAAEYVERWAARDALAIARRVLGEPIWHLSEILNRAKRAELAREIRRQRPTLPTKYAVAQNRDAAIEYALRKFGATISLRTARYRDPQQTINEAEQLRRQRYERRG